MLKDLTIKISLALLYLRMFSHLFEQQHSIPFRIKKKIFPICLIHFSFLRSLVLFMVNGAKKLTNINPITFSLFFFFILSHYIDKELRIFPLDSRFSALRFLLILLLLHLLLLCVAIWIVWYVRKCSPNGNTYLKWKRNRNCNSNNSRNGFKLIRIDAFELNIEKILAKRQKEQQRKKERKK